MSADDNYETLNHVLTDYSPLGWAAEFGVYSGQSITRIAEHMPVLGFDSFDGLPEDWRPGFPKGTFRRSRNTLRHLPKHCPNVMLIDGMFEDTATNFPFPALGLVHIDCDLYSSTVTALDSVKNAIGVGTYVVFDEYHGYPGHEDHEMKAWGEFCATYQITAEMITTGAESAAFVIHDIGERP